MVFLIALGFVSVLAGSVAAVAGFGIGSIVTPLIALKVGTGIAVAAVSIAHFFGTLLRFIFWRKYVNKQVLISFGLTSALGGLIGAFFNHILVNNILTLIFGLLLIFAGVMGFTGFSDRLRFSGITAWIAGALSGFFGGLVGNQGGIRSASMLGFKLNQKEFVATATGIALMVDLARMPVYIVLQGKELLSIWTFIVIGTIGVFIGTFVGSWILIKIPENLFKKLISAIIFVIGIFVLIQR